MDALRYDHGLFMAIIQVKLY